jgi:hypothetical protein
LGKQGEQGAQGVPGPTGYVDESSTEVTASSGSVNHNAASIASFPTVVTDEAAIVSSATTLSLYPGGWQGTAWIRFVKRAGINGTGSRKVEAVLASTVIAALTVAASPDTDTDVTLAFTVNPVIQSSLQIRITQTDGAALSYSGRLWVVRIGAGIQGPIGPAGPLGNTGAVGPQGPQGPAGGVMPSSTTFADLGG